MGKKNKSKEDPAVDDEQYTEAGELTAVDGGLTHKKKKKKSKKMKEKLEVDDSLTVKEKSDSCSTVDGTSAGDDSKDSSKKKKKKRKAEAAEQTEAEEGPTESKKKKKSVASEDAVPQQIGDGIDAFSTEDLSKKKKQKKKDKKSRNETVDNSIAADMEIGIKGQQNSHERDRMVDSVVKKHKKKKRKISKAEPDTDIHQEKADSDCESENKKKRKKEKRKEKTLSVELEAADENGVGKNGSEEDSEPSKKKKKKKKDKREEKESETVEACEVLEGDGGKKSKKEKKAEITASDDISSGKDVDSKEKKKSKKKKKNTAEHQVGENSGNTQIVSHQSAPVKEQVDGRQPVATLVNTVQVGQNGDLEPNHNCDEDRSSTPHSKALGQWSTNMFESSERQDKFLRLLGGFKKGSTTGPSGPAKKALFGSLKPSPGCGGQAALSIDQAKVMNQRLESDFERALNFRGQRGIGLGFQPDPAEGKKFHIDINKTTSRKFDD